jgi:hypothetical protein
VKAEVRAFLYESFVVASLTGSHGGHHACRYHRGVSVTGPRSVSATNRHQRHISHESVAVPYGFRMG